MTEGFDFLERKGWWDEVNFWNPKRVGRIVMNRVDWRQGTLKQYFHSGLDYGTVIQCVKRNEFVEIVIPRNIQAIAYLVCKIRIPAGARSVKIKGEQGEARASTSTVSGRDAAAVMATSRAVPAAMWGRYKAWRNDVWTGSKKVWRYTARARAIPAWSIVVPVVRGAREITFALAVNDPWEQERIVLQHHRLEWEAV